MLLDIGVTHYQIGEGMKPVNLAKQVTSTRNATVSHSLLS
jgi:hypothetical protein